MPWLEGGNLNVTLGLDKKLGGLMGGDPTFISCW